MKPTTSRRTLTITIVTVVALLVIVPLIGIGGIARVASGIADQTATNTAAAPTTDAPDTTERGNPTTRPEPEPRVTNPFADIAAGETSVPTPDPTQTKPGPATCKEAAVGLATAINPTGTTQAWRARMAPLVTGDIERVLPTVDTTAIPEGKPTVTDVIEQLGACDAVLTWTGKPPVSWRVVFVDQGAGWIATEWSAA